MRRIIASILALVALMGPAAVFCSSARADGDPASDVLATPTVSVFDPPDSGATREQAAQLTAAVRAADQAGFPIKVALIGSSSDLGSVTQDWGDPSAYAAYLEAELSYLFRGRLLVVMPQGSRLYSAHPTPGDSRAMAGVQSGGDLAGIATQTVVDLAGANGHPIHVGAVHLQEASAGPSSPVPLIALLAGAVLLVVAWGISLRIRPLRRRVLA